MREGPQAASPAPRGHLEHLERIVPGIGGEGDAPIVLAFVPSWHEGDGRGDTLEGIRAELRGLGATLVVLSDREAWFFRADDEPEGRPLTDPALRAEVLDLAESLELPRSRDQGGWPLTVFVIDEGTVLRFPGGDAGDGPTCQRALLDALHAAGLRLVERPCSPWLVSRREALVASLVAGFALMLFSGCRRSSSTSTPAVDAERDVEVRLNVNGEDRTLRVDPRSSVLDVLRERMALTGTKKGCDHGQCGACTVLQDDRRVLACLTLAVAAQGSKIVTIEGLAGDKGLHPVQEAFVALDAFQCGYCTPGQIMSAVGLLREGRAHSDDEVREEMSGNICRCGAYPNIVKAVQRARG